MRLFSLKKKIILGGVMVYLSPILAEAKINLDPGSTVEAKKDAVCEVMFSDEFLKNYDQAYEMTPVQKEEIIHAEKVQVCFNNLGIIASVVPFTQMAGIENL